MKRPALLATLFVFVITLTVALPSGAVQAAEPQGSIKPIPLVFHLPDGDVPTLIDPSSIAVMFNPREYTITKATPWKNRDVTSDSPKLEFTSGEPFRLQMDLFFDTYEEKTDVRLLTDKIEKLALVNQELHRPPTALVTWGTGLQFKCILESFSLRFTLFLDDGTPVRAVMNAVFKEFAPAEEQLKGNPRH